MSFIKKIGIIGGLGPEATVDYYKEIINRFKTEGGEMNYPEIVLYSVNMADFLKPLNQQKWEEAASYIVSKIEALHRAGADFAAISANTPHLLFEMIREKSPLHLISIVEATGYKARQLGLTRPGLIGTRFTMNASFYPDTFKKYGMEVIVPSEREKALINRKLFSEIELGIFKDDTRQELIDITKRMVNDDHIDSLILGCTEFPLILTEPEYAGIPMLNTTAIHVDAIVKYCLS
ncbi:MAG TPA: amino acid racemase [Lentimicrobium sp.]|nr:amino acid racemase [Lentimicrobium sp.]